MDYHAHMHLHTHMNTQHTLQGIHAWEGERHVLSAAVYPPQQGGPCPLPCPCLAQSPPGLVAVLVPCHPGTAPLGACKCMCKVRSQFADHKGPGILKEAMYSRIVYSRIVCSTCKVAQR